MAQRKARLTYYIFEGLLVGTVDGKFIHITALSGGGGGTKLETGPEEPATVNNPYLTGQILKEGQQRGGPLPVGTYFILPPEPWGNSVKAKLQPTQDMKNKESFKSFFDRTGRDGGFLIHGRGPRGSDGCIVPVRREDFQNLMRGLASDGGGILWVEETTEGQRFA